MLADQLITLRNDSAMTLPLVLILVALILGVLIQRILFFVLSRIVKPERHETWRATLRETRQPMLLLLPLLTLSATLPFLNVSEAVDKRLGQGLNVAVTVAFVWLAIAMMTVSSGLIVRDYQRRNHDPLRRRQVETRVLVLNRVLKTIVILVAFAGLLTMSPGGRALGTTLLASAGVLGLVTGFAARPVLESLFAGLQIAFTQPIRLGDSVVVDNQQGVIDEIGASYVVIRTLDTRNLIVPLTYFLTNMFVNLSRKDAVLLAEFHLLIDLVTPIALVRQELVRFVADSPLWDQHTCILQVADVKDNAVDIRVTLGARSQADVWTLRVEALETLHTFMQNEKKKLTSGST